MRTPEGWVSPDTGSPATLNRNYQRFLEYIGPDLPYTPPFEKTGGGEQQEVDPASFVCAGGPASSRFEVMGDKRGREVVDRLPETDWRAAIAYELMKALADSAPSELTKAQKAEAFLTGLNDVLSKYKLSARFEEGKDGEPSQLIFTKDGKDLPAIALYSDVIEQGRKGERLAEALLPQLKTVNPPLTNETLRQAMVDLINSSFPERSGQTKEQRAARIQTVMPVINKMLHASGFHMEIDNDCVVRFYSWDGKTKPGTRGDEITDPKNPLALSPSKDHAAQVADVRVTTIVSQFPTAEDLVTMSPADRNKLGRTIYQQYRNVGDPLVPKLNEQLHKKGMHIEITFNEGRRELLIYAWAADKKSDMTLVPPIKLDETVDIAMQHRSKRDGVDVALLVATALASFADNGTKPNEKMLRGVTHFFWEAMRDEEGLMSGEDLTARRVNFAREVQTALRTQGLDLEFDPKDPMVMKIYQWKNNKRVGEPLVFNRPEQYNPPSITDPAVTEPQSPYAGENGFIMGILATLGALWALKRVRKWFGGKGDGPGTSGVKPPDNPPDKPKDPPPDEKKDEKKEEKKEPPKDEKKEEKKEPPKDEKTEEKKESPKGEEKGEGKRTKLVKGRAPGSNTVDKGSAPGGKVDVATGGADIKAGEGGGVEVTGGKGTEVAKEGKVEDLKKEEIGKLKEKILNDKEAKAETRALALKVLDMAERGDPVARKSVAGSLRKMREKGGTIEGLDKAEGKGVGTLMVITAIAGLYLIYKLESTPSPYVPKAEIH